MGLENLIQSKNIDVKKIPGGIPQDRHSLKFRTSNQ